jgi:hypothetical protein
MASAMAGDCVWIGALFDILCSLFTGLLSKSSAVVACMPPIRHNTTFERRPERAQVHV